MVVTVMYCSGISQLPPFWQYMLVYGAAILDHGRRIRCNVCHSIFHRVKGPLHLLNMKDVRRPCQNMIFVPVYLDGGP